MYLGAVSDGPPTCGYKGEISSCPCDPDYSLPWGTFAKVCCEKATRMFVCPTDPKVFYRCELHATWDRPFFEDAGWVEVGLVTVEFAPGVKKP